jgi:hypothetical protein
MAQSVMSHMETGHISSANQGYASAPRVHIFRAVASSMAPVQRCRSIRLGCPALPSGHDPVMIGLPGLTGQGTILFNEVAPGGAENT